MSRSDIENVEDRRPFYLYVDEFQNFATDSFAVILSEARKYGLNLTVANQYVSQMTDSVRDAVFGNVGTTICFRVSADDAPILSKQFEPVFEAQDLLSLNNRHFVVSMIINGEKTPGFSATTLSIPKPPNDLMPRIIKYSRLTYARTRDEVEKEIRDNIEAAEKWKKNLSDSGREAGERGAMPVATAIAEARQVEKPVYKFTPTPQQDFRKQKISPNQAQGEAQSGNSLKDLAALVKERNQKLQKESPNIITSEDEEEEQRKVEEEEAKKVDNSVAEMQSARPVITSADLNGVNIPIDHSGAQGGHKKKNRNRNKNRNKNRS